MSMSQLYQGEEKCRICMKQKRPLQSLQHQKKQYFEALDLVVNCMKDRFDQPGYQVYRHLEDVLLKSVRGDKTCKEDLHFVIKFYCDDLDQTSQSLQLETIT
jgi:hypothetical protein